MYFVLPNNCVKLVKVISSEVEYSIRVDNCSEYSCKEE